MSGVEIVGLAASVLQVADYGWKTSYKLYAFSKKVHEAGKTIELISQDISATGAVLKQLGDRVEEDVKASPRSRLCSQGLINAATKLVEECKDLFKDIDLSIGGSDGNKVILGFKQKLKWSYLEPRVELLRANLERLKSSLALMLNVLMYAEQLRSREERTVLVETQNLVASFAKQRADAEKGISQIELRIENEPTTVRKEMKPVSSILDEQSLSVLTKDQKQKTQPKLESVVETSKSVTSSAHPHLVLVNAVKTTEVDNFTASASNERPEERESRPNDDAGVPKEASNFMGLEQQRLLIEKLLEEVNSSRYAIDYGVRYRLYDGVLSLHWLEWAPLRSTYGDEVLRGLLTESPILARHWHDCILKSHERPAMGQHALKFKDVGVADRSVMAYRSEAKSPFGSDEDSKSRKNGTKLGGCYDNEDRRRRYSGGTLRRARPAKDARSYGSVTPPAAEMTKKSTVKGKNKGSPEESAIDPTLSGEGTPGSEGEISKDEANHQTTWVENVRLIEWIRDMVKKKLETAEFDENREEIKGDAEDDERSSKEKAAAKGKKRSMAIESSRQRSGKAVKGLDYGRDEAAVSAAAANIADSLLMQWTTLAKLDLATNVSAV